jgi:alpha-glutamyl/putrescinyl thymine pyrophosphorylase clade 1
MIPTRVYDTYWRFAAERLAMYYRRFANPSGPWTSDPILQTFRFTNVYRAADRVSQYLIREVQYRLDRPQSPYELFFRTILFKLFNRIDTWEALERVNGPLVWDTIDLDAVNHTLDKLLTRGRSIYSAAYIMPSPPFGHARKHTNHLALLARMMDDRLPNRLRQAPNLQTIYEAILAYPGLGPFLAFQYTIDLNYSSLLDFDEREFVVAGPGAHDGIAKCFSDVGRRSAEDIIHWVSERHEAEFAARGLEFTGLFGRRLQPIDCQNLFCEISKYARAAHPDVRGIADRQRIKQTYKPDVRPMPEPMFPPKWRMKLPKTPSVMPGLPSASGAQGYFPPSTVQHMRSAALRHKSTQENAAHLRLDAERTVSKAGEK